VPGQGRLSGVSGIIVTTLDAKGNEIETVFEGGPHDDFVAAICTALA
jgi:hypothetical protein